MSPTYPSADKVESSLAEASLGQDFRQFLRAELIRRCKKNAKYSLRAFAQALGVSPAYLSMIFNGRKKPVAATILKMGNTKLHFKK
jgi:AraC-like DNA-binding protein